MISLQKTDDCIRPHIALSTQEIDCIHKFQPKERCTVNIALQQEPKSRSLSLWERIKNILLISSLLSLLSFNIATLTNDTFHAAAFNVLGSALRHALGSELTDQVLRHSPAIKRGKDVEIATKELTDENKALKKDKGELIKSNNALIKNKEKLTKNNNALKEEHGKLKTESAKLKEEHAKLKTASAKKSAAVQKTSKRMAYRSTVGATRNFASLPGEAIPLWGTALIIGVTTWDIYDFCENLKDLNELNDVFAHQLEDQDKVCGMKMKIPTKEQVMAEARENWQEAYRAATYQIELSHKNAGDLVNQTYDEAKKQVIQTGDDLEDQLEETYRDTIKKINQINRKIQIPPLTEIWETNINRLYNLFGKFAQ